MLRRSLVVFVVAAFAALGAEGQSQSLQPTLTPQDSGTTNGLIAVSPVNPQVVWASGRAGTFVVTTDGGNTWKAGVVPGAEALQFRDVEGVSAKVAYLQSIGNDPTDFRIYKTVDGGADVDADESASGDRGHFRTGLRAWGWQRRREPHRGDHGQCGRGSLDPQ